MNYIKSYIHDMKYVIQNLIYFSVSKKRTQFTSHFKVILREPYFSDLIVNPFEYCIKLLILDAFENSLPKNLGNIGR